MRENPASPPTANASSAPTAATLAGGATAEKEKRRAALSSVVAAVFLTAMKLVVGLATNSLGILSEAAHSGLDLIAAAVTYFAVRLSDKPADEDHPYGHGKAENLSALIETILLLLTCAWIAYEAVMRLFVAAEPVEVTVYSFGVMAVSILVDVSRSRMLLAMAKKHKSQALEADALHFSTDVWSSCVVIAGLIAVFAGERLAPSPLWREWLVKADAAAGLIVAAIVIHVGWRMGRSAVDALMDGGSAGLAAELREAVGMVPGVADVASLRLRLSGPAAFVDMTLLVSRQATFEESHRIADEAETAVRDVLPGADTLVHLEPVAPENGGLIEAVRSLAARQGVSVHGILAHHLDAGVRLEMHAEVPEDLTLEAAHARVSALEAAIVAEIPEVASVATHIEPLGEAAARRQSQPADTSHIAWEIKTLCAETPGVLHCHNIVILDDGGRPSVSFHCRMGRETPITAAHDTATALEAALRARLPGLRRVVIHMEPESRNVP